ncbi:hypothetical protein VTH06DRAFT_3535 [Thermothelomyces fergusii]
MEKLKVERDTMSRRVQSQEEQIRQVQALAFKDIGSDSWTAGDDGTVRADLENLHGRLKSWAKKHAIQDMGEISKLAPEEYQMLIRCLAEIVRLGPGMSFSTVEHLLQPPMNRKSPAMCIQGLLAHHVYSWIISQPFFAFGNRADLLQEIIGHIQQVDQNESHILRSRILRLLAAAPRPSVGQGDSTNDRYGEFQKAVCRKHAEWFYGSPVRHLIKPAGAADGDAAAQCFTELQSIMQSAGELSHKLWSRRTTLRVLTLRDFEGVRFGKGLEHMRAHPLHRLYEDDDRCNDWLVNMVTHPAVLGFGSGDGKDYETPRVWIKAEVWLAEEAANEAADRAADQAARGGA